GPGAERSPQRRRRRRRRRAAARRPGRDRRGEGRHDVAAGRARPGLGQRAQPVGRGPAGERGPRERARAPGRPPALGRLRRGARRLMTKGFVMRGSLRLLTAFTAIAVVVAMAGPASAAPTPPNFDSSAAHGNESEDAIAVNPTNPSNVVTMATLPDVVAGLF